MMLLLLSRSAVVSLGQIWFDMGEPALKHLLYFQYNAEEASAHVWILKDPHYSLDTVHRDALLETAETFGVPA